MAEVEIVVKRETMKEDLDKIKEYAKQDFPEGNVWCKISLTLLNSLVKGKINGNS